MVAFDLTPFYRSTIGFDRMARVLENAAQVSDMTNGYPPYDIQAVGDDHYRVTIAVAGFDQEDLGVEVRENVLYVTADRKDEEPEAHYLHQGIAARAFKKQFRLADHVRVENAWLDKGLLTIDLVRELPEAMKPRRIEIAPEAPRGLASKAKRLLGSEKKAA